MGGSVVGREKKDARLGSAVVWVSVCKLCPVDLNSGSKKLDGRRLSPQFLNGQQRMGAHLRQNGKQKNKDSVGTLESFLSLKKCPLDFYVLRSTVCPFLIKKKKKLAILSSLKIFLKFFIGL